MRKGKFSSYIVELIKADCFGGKDITREEVIALILQYCGQNKNTAVSIQNIDIESSIQSVLGLLGEE